jgi:hypothetical protein
MIFVRGNGFIAATLTPSYFLGEVLGRRGLQALAHTGSAASLDPALGAGAVMVPKEFAGWRMDPAASKLIAEAPALANDAFHIAESDSPSSGMLRFGSRLGAVFSLSMEFRSFEQELKQSNDLGALDMDSYYLFDGFKSAQPHGKIYGAYRIENTSFDNPAKDSPAQPSRGQKQPAQRDVARSKEAVQDMLRKLFDISAPICPNREACSWVEPHIPEGNRAFGWKHIVARHITGSSGDAHADLFPGKPTYSELSRIAREIARPENRCLGHCADILNFESRANVAGNSLLVIMGMNRFSGVVLTMFPPSRAQRCTQNRGEVATHEERPHGASRQP